MKTISNDYEDVISKNEKKIEKLEKIVQNSDNLYHSYIELFSKSILISFELRLNNENLIILRNELKEEKEKIFNILKEKNEFKDQFEKSEQRIKDLKVEFTSRTKMKEKQLKELKSILIEKQKEEENQSNLNLNQNHNHNGNNGNYNSSNGGGGVSFRVNSHNNGGGNNDLSPNLKRIHSRENSFNKSISSGSDDNTSLVNDLETSQIMKENNQLLIRVGELQTIKWKMEERLRVLSISIEQLKEDVEKKKQIIQYYMQKEKLGRLTPEQEMNKQTMLQKNKKMDPKILQESFNQMQQVMEETILQNIQLQSHIKTLGSEIQRLLNENKKLQEKLK